MGITILFNLETAVEMIKNHPCFDRLSMNGLTKLLGNPLALSSPHSGRVEEVSICQLPDLG